MKYSPNFLTQLFPALSSEVDRVSRFLDRFADKFGPISPMQPLPSSHSLTDAYLFPPPASQQPSLRHVHGHRSPQRSLLQSSAHDDGLERVFSETTIEHSRRRFSSLLHRGAGPSDPASSAQTKKPLKSSVAPKKGLKLSKKDPSVPLRLPIALSAVTDDVKQTKPLSAKSAVKRPADQPQTELSPDKPFVSRKRRRMSRSASVSNQECGLEDAVHIPRSKSKDSGRSLPSRRRSFSSKDAAPDARTSPNVVPVTRIPLSVQVADSSGSSTKMISPRKKPLERILDFARGKTSQFVKLDTADKNDVLRRRTSLATFIGCGEFSDVSLAAYLRVLCTSHTEAVKAATLDNSFQVKLPNIDAVFCELSTEEMSRAISSSETTQERQGVVSPPHIRHTVDVLQLVFRTWQKMSSNDETVMCGFLDSLYAQSAVIAVSSLSTSVLKLWKERNEISGQVAPARSELLEWCVRLLANIIAFELSPVSSILNVKSARSPLLFVDYVGKESNVSLSQVLNIILEYVGSESATGRECKQAATDIFQVYLIRHHYLFQMRSPQEKPWKTILDASSGHVQHLIQHKTFWPLTVTFAIQTVKKNQQQAEVWVATAFLVSILCEPVASRSLLEKQTKVRHALFEVFLKLLERMGRDILSFVVEIENALSMYPKLPTAQDLIRKLMSFAIVQREMISSRELGWKDRYLEAIENIISRAAKLVEGPVDSAKLMACAHKRDRGKMLDELQRGLVNQAGGQRASSAGTESELEDPEAIKLKTLARYRALAFVAWLIGSLGKSMEDGSRDMAQMNGLCVLTASRFSGMRRLGKLWADVVKIQCGLENRIPAGLTGALPHSLAPFLSASERNYFSMVVEAIRSKLVAETKGKEGRGSPDSSSKQSSSDEGSARVPKNANVNVHFPEVKKIKQLRNAICSTKGYQDLDDDPNMLEHVIKKLKAESEETLARYDPESNLTTPWVRLNRRNAYVEGARDCLDKEDKILGNPCSCLPGNPTDRNNGSQNRIACSNDSCENRLTKVECVPGECGAGSYCQNQRMQKLEYARTKTVLFPNKGVGVVANEDILAGGFIGEYQGEVISNETFNKRKKEYCGERHFYFMTLTSKLVIDASRKSQFTRYVNHSCDPNAETQKWNAGGEPRVGIFAMRNILKGEEVTFDYGARSLANDAVPCLCGAKSCRGFLTTKKTQERDEDDVPVDVSGLANAADPVQETGQQMEQAKKDEPDLSIADEEEFREDIAERIQKAKENLAMVEDLTARKTEASKVQALFDESALDTKTKAILAEWEASIQRKQKAKAVVKADSAAKSEARIRIPRRPPQPQPAAQQSFLRSFIEQKKPKDVELKGISKPKPKNPHIRKSDASKSGVRAEHSELTLQREEQASAKQPDAQPVVDKPDPTHTVAQRPIAGRKIMPFLPTSTKFKRPLLRPIIAPKAKRNSSRDDNDSMDGYSTASSIEPIMDDSDLVEAPNSLGARSEDEFVAEPPLEGERRGNGHGDERIRHEPGHNVHVARHRNGVLEGGHPDEVRDHCNREIERQRSLRDMRRRNDLYGRPDDGRENSWPFRNESYDDGVAFRTNGIQNMRNHNSYDPPSPRFRESFESRPREAPRFDEDRGQYGMEKVSEGKLRGRQSGYGTSQSLQTRDHRPPFEVYRGDNYHRASFRNPEREIYRGASPGIDWNRNSYRAHEGNMKYYRNVNRPPFTRLDRDREHHPTSSVGLVRNRNSDHGPLPGARLKEESQHSPVPGYHRGRNFREASASDVGGKWASELGMYRNGDSRRSSPLGIDRSRNINLDLGKDKSEVRSRRAEIPGRYETNHKPDPGRPLKDSGGKSFQITKESHPQNSSTDLGRGRGEDRMQRQDSHGEGEKRERTQRMNDEDHLPQGDEWINNSKDGVPLRLSECNLKLDSAVSNEEGRHLETHSPRNDKQPIDIGQREKGGKEDCNSKMPLSNRGGKSDHLHEHIYKPTETVSKELNGSSAPQPPAASERREQKSGDGSQLGEVNSWSKKDSTLRKDFPEGLPGNPRETGDNGMEASRNRKTSAEKMVTEIDENVAPVKVDEGKLARAPSESDKAESGHGVADVTKKEKSVAEEANSRASMADKQTRKEVLRKDGISGLDSSKDGTQRGADDVAKEAGKDKGRSPPRNIGTHPSRFKKVRPETSGVKRPRADLGMDEKKRVKTSEDSFEKQMYVRNGKSDDTGSAGEVDVGCDERKTREEMVGERGRKVFERVGPRADARNGGRSARESVNGRYWSGRGQVARGHGEGGGGRRKKASRNERSPGRGENGRMQKMGAGPRRWESRLEYEGGRRSSAGGNLEHSQQGGKGEQGGRDLRNLINKRR